MALLIKTLFIRLHTKVFHCMPVRKLHFKRCQLIPVLKSKNSKKVIFGHLQWSSSGYTLGCNLKSVDIS
jgi:hypothetical protein